MDAGDAVFLNDDTRKGTGEARKVSSEQSGKVGWGQALCQCCPHFRGANQVSNAVWLCSAPLRTFHILSFGCFTIEVLFHCPHQCLYPGDVIGSRFFSAQCSLSNLRDDRVLVTQVIFSEADLRPFSWCHAMIII